MQQCPSTEPPLVVVILIMMIPLVVRLIAIVHGHMEISVIEVSNV